MSQVARAARLPLSADNAAQRNERAARCEGGRLPLCAATGIGGASTGAPRQLTPRLGSRGGGATP